MILGNYSLTESSQLDFNYSLSISKRICVEKFLFFCCCLIFSQKFAEWGKDYIEYCAMFVTFAEW